MAINKQYVQLFVRLAVGTAFFSAVADRLGYWGAAGSPNVSWGNWENFLSYSNTLNFFVSDQLGKVLAVTATVLEILFGFLLLLGYQTKIISVSSGILLMLFGLSMTMSLGIKSTFDYSVWIGASACFLLASINTYKYSIDHYLQTKKR